MTDARLQELAQLLTSQIDGVLDDASRQRVAALLRGDAQSQQFYVDYCQMHAMLAWEHGVLVEAVFGDEPQATSRPSIKLGPTFSGRWRLLALAVSLMLAVAAGWFLWSRSTQDELAITAAPVAWETRDAVGEVTQCHGAQLSVPDVMIQLVVGGTVRTGEYELLDGFVQLTFENGVQVIVESPASFQVVTGMRVVLHSGRLSARGSELGDGFTVETPTADVVDFGTEFSVEVESDQSSEVHVFDGEVHVQPKTSSSEADTVRLHTDQATRIDRSSGVPQGIDIDRDRFVRDLDEPRLPHQRAVRALNPVTFFRMGCSVDGRTLENKGQFDTPGLVVPCRMKCPPFAPGRVGSSLRLGGPKTGAYAVLSEYQPATENVLSVCAWVWAECRPRHAAIARNFARGSGGQFHFGLFQDDGDVKIHVRDMHDMDVIVREGVPLPLAQWHHVAFVVDGAMLRLYRNGEEVASKPCQGLRSDGPDALGIGVWLDESGTCPDPKNPGFWHGRIDELAIFHEALSGEQIRQLYESAQLLGT